MCCFQRARALPPEEMEKLHVCHEMSSGITLRTMPPERSELKQADP